MTRAAVTARDAVEEDVPRLLALYDELREAGPRRAVRTAGDVEQLREEVGERYSKAVWDPDERLIVATEGEEVIGMTLATIGSASSLVDAPSVLLTHFCVGGRRRRRGVGRALVASATAWAEERGVDGLSVAVYPASREANRFLAQLGFAPVYLSRTAPVAGLRRRLGVEVPTSADLDEGTASRRRRLRVGITGRAGRASHTGHAGHTANGARRPSP